MSISKLKGLLCRGQHDAKPESSCPGEQDTDDKKEPSTKSKGSRYVVSVTVMRKRRTSPQVLLKASISTVLVISIVFIVLYTILLKYFSPRVPYMPGEWERVQNGHHRLIPRPMNNGDYLSRNRTVKWTASDYFTNFDLKGSKHLCQGEYQFLILIVSSREQFDRRQNIRDTWCKSPTVHHLSANSWRCVFLIGEVQSGLKEGNFESKLELERQNYNDILKGSYIDTYRNLTIKVLHGLHWASQSCRTEFILKTDDDCFVNTILLNSLILHHRDASNLYIGSVYKKHDKLKVIRNPANRWHVDRESYSEEYYPLYASGVGYLLSSDVVHRLVDLSRFFAPFPNEDAYIGVLVEELRVLPTHSARFTLTSTGWSLCNFRYLVVMHLTQPHEQFVMYNKSIQALETHQCRQSNRGPTFTWN